MRSQSAVKRSSKTRVSSVSARSGRVRATIFTTGTVSTETTRLSAGGQVGRLNARRVSGLTRHGTGPTSGHRSFENSREDDCDRPRPSEAPTC
jgi:hypothetical protein